MPVTSLPVSKCQFPCQPLVEENTLSLTQLQSLVASLASTSYSQLFGSQSVGKHVRHIIEHYQTLLAGYANAPHVDQIYYEQRPREEALEESPAVAANTINALQSALHALNDKPTDTPLILNYPVGHEGHAYPLASSLGRELAFLTSHTVHHMALIRLLCDTLSVTVPEDFGVHPSTLRHWRQSTH